MWIPGLGCCLTFIPVNWFKKSFNIKSYSSVPRISLCRLCPYWLGCCLTSLPVQWFKESCNGKWYSSLPRNSFVWTLPSLARLLQGILTKLFKSNSQSNWALFCVSIRKAVRYLVCKKGGFFSLLIKCKLIQNIAVNIDICTCAWAEPIWSVTSSKRLILILSRFLAVILRKILKQGAESCMHAANEIKNLKSIESKSNE